MVLSGFVPGNYSNPPEVVETPPVATLKACAINRESSGVFNGLICRKLQNYSECLSWFLAENLFFK